MTPSTPAAPGCVPNVDEVVARKALPDSAAAALPTELRSKLDAAAKASFKQAAAPGAIVGIQTPEGKWTQAYGEADPPNGTEMAVGMHTRIGSVTKTFTGTVILQLVQDGSLSLDDPIQKYVAGVPNGGQVTIRQLLDMTSGVASYTKSTKFTDVLFARPQTVFIPDQLIKIGLSESPVFKPGTDFEYSNTNTLLLGKVIEKVTGRSVKQVFAERVFDPLMLRQTSWPGDSPAMPKPYAQGYTLQGDAATKSRPSNATHWNPSWGWTAGELISEMDDLLVYGRALGTGLGLLDPATQATRLRSLPAPASYGLALTCSGGWVGHTGTLPGYNTTLFYHAPTDTTMIIQVNSDIASGDCPQSPTLTDNQRDIPCSSPAIRMFVGLSTAFGHPYPPNPLR